MLEVPNSRALQAFESRIDKLEQKKFVALEKAAKKPAPVRPFAEMFELSLRFLTSPYDCWKSGRPEVQKLVLKLTLNKPLRYDRKTGCLNPEKSMIFNVLEGFEESNGKMVLPERFELSTSPLPRECSTPELRQRSYVRRTPQGVAAAGVCHSPTRGARHQSHIAESFSHRPAPCEEAPDEA